MIGQSIGARIPDENSKRIIYSIKNVVSDNDEDMEKKMKYFPGLFASILIMVGRRY